MPDPDPIPVDPNVIVINSGSSTEHGFDNICLAVTYVISNYPTTAGCDIYTKIAGNWVGFVGPVPKTPPGR